MLVMVLAENMVQLILGWEIMGLCSFMLIGHWWEDEANARAALEGVLHRPRRRRRPARRHGDALLGLQRLDPGEPRRVGLQHPGDLGVGAVRRRQPRACCCGPPSRCSSPASARAASSRCTPGCPTPWPARPRCRRCCTRRRWSSPASSSSPGSTPCSGRASRSPTSAPT